MDVAGSIYVDVDDVLSQTAAALLDVLERRFGKRLSVEEVTDFDLSVSLGLDPAQLAEFMVAAHEDHVLEGMAPVAGAVDVIERWIRDGYHVSIVTGRPPAATAATRRWLEKARIPHHVLSCVDKYGRHGRHEGTVPLSELAGAAFRLAVEDSVQVAKFLVEETGAEVALLDRPWNRDVSSISEPLRRRVIRVESWDEIGRRFRAP